jgi:hypothetical protein
MPVYDEARVRRFFGIEAEDVAANRVGRLGRRQRRNYRTTLVIWSVLLVIWFGAMSFAVVIQLDGDSWHGVGNLIGTFVFIALIAAMPVVIISRVVRYLSARLVITTITGPVSVGNGYLVVAGRRLRIPRPYNGQGGRGPELRPWVDESLTYDVFAARGRAIAMATAG